MPNMCARYLLVSAAICVTHLTCGPLAADSDLDADWTVVTLAATGAWGVGRSLQIGEAISKAIIDCEARAGVKSNCGAEYSVIRGGWTVATLCGNQKILGTGRNLREAELAALSRELVLSEQYVENLSPCTRLFTVNPTGAVYVGGQQLAHP